MILHMIKGYFHNSALISMKDKIEGLVAPEASFPLLHTLIATYLINYSLFARYEN